MADKIFKCVNPSCPMYQKVVTVDGVDYVLRFGVIHCDKCGQTLQKA